MKTNIHTPEPQASTLSGELSLLDPDPAKINILDIVTALGHQVRYAGHTTKPVTILQHSVHVWLLARSNGASIDVQRQALWHDAAEAYLLDIPRPLKKLLGEAYSSLERKFNRVVGEALGVDLIDISPIVHYWDTLALAAECRLWRPVASWADWTGLPQRDLGDEQLALLARRIAEKPRDVYWLDGSLREGDDEWVDNILESARGTD